MRIAFGPEDAADLSENIFGVFSLPLGVATNFTINGTDALVPMATEEASVIAAASNAARMARPHGGFFTSSTEPVMQAQIQLINVADPQAARTRILERESEIIDLANAQDPKLVEVGGGVKGLDGSPRRGEDFDLCSRPPARRCARCNGGECCQHHG
jgi:hydroxymethylglutaryl-CoA reductase